MQGSGVEVDLEGDLDRAIWLKFLGNIAAAPVTTLTDRRMEVLREPAVEGLLRDLIAEAVSVAIAEGVNIGPADGENTLAALRGMDPAVTTSMQADRASGRSLEVEELSGALDRLAVKHRLSAPVNRTVLSLLRALPRNRG